MNPDPDSVGVRALDETTLFVELEEPTAYFLYLLAACMTSFPVPRHVVEAHGEGWTEVGNFVTNGPFKLQTWRQGDPITLVRNPKFHGRLSGNLQRVEVYFLSEPQASLKMYEADNLDVLYLDSFPLPSFDRARRRHAGEYISVPRPGTIYIDFDKDRAPFDDVRVRRAFVLAADRKEYSDVLMGIGSPATGGFVPPGIPGHSAGIGLPYDPEGARQLLAEAGFPDGSGFPTVKGFGPSLLGEYLQTQWRENLKVEITWEALGFEAEGDIPYWDRWGEVLPHVWSARFHADYPDPDSMLKFFIPQDEHVWRNEVYIELIEQARSTVNQGERTKLYGRADRLLMEEAIIMPIEYLRQHLLVKPWVTRYPLVPHNTMWFLKDVIVEPH
jgi:oligopeptide transport system substrate-binding protein